ncbi:MAG: hypothetical protein OEZ14_12870 [Acidimicrobiia bacterium]|nr:hypothetical protein [Acidimicrobiia bacterium]MDH4308856.1 hypothetical protein [Acidimicrobiia bacterium]MDH5292783.1 hypothetical protein [Acidimicrobiia bacterium]MDH5521413.1 hypothetical protein [Acidimicrobiia bacterium]
MTPTVDTASFHDLIAVLANERRTLEELLFRHAEISMLIAAGEHRFVGRAIDEALDVESRLAAGELMRAIAVAEVYGDDATLAQVLAAAPADAAEHLARLADDMARLVSEVERYRREASAWAGERAGKLREAIDRFGSEFYSAERVGS